MNVIQAAPFFKVSNMQASLRYYVEGSGCRIKRSWGPGGRLRWRRLSLDGAALMLQEFPTEGHDSWKPRGPVGEGVTICFTCADALQFYREVAARGSEASEPFAGNGTWVTTRLTDPDGYRPDFESAAEAPEGTRLGDTTR